MSSFNNSGTHVLSNIYKRFSCYFPFLPSHIDIHFRELLKGSSLVFIIYILGMAAGYLFTLLVTRNYGAEAMGILALSQTILLITSIICKLGLDSASLRFVAEYASQGKWSLLKEFYIKNLKLLIPIAIFMSFILFYISPFISKHLFKNPQLSTSFQIISISVLPFVMLFLHSESFRGLKKVVAYAAFRNVSIPFVSSVVLLIAVHFSKDASMPIVAYVAGTIILSLASLVIWLKYVGIFNYKSEKSISYKTMLSVSLPMLLSSSMFFIMHWTDTIMLGMFRSEADVGIYNVALKIANITSISLFAINSIAAPKFAEFYTSGDIKGLGKVAKQSTKLIFWSSFPVLLVFFFFPSFILGVFGEEFKVGIYALLFLTIGQFVNAISGSVGFILQMTGKQKVFQNIMLIATVLNIVLNIVLIPKYGIHGAAFASMIAISFWNLASVFYIKSYLNIVTLYIPILTRRKS